MRDILVLLIVVGATPFVFRRAWTGILLWCWLSYMNPHRLTWSFAASLPLAQYAAIVTLLALPMDKSPKRIPFGPVIWIWLAFVLWLNLTTMTAIYPESALVEWDRTMKIMFTSFLTIYLITDKMKLMAMTWVIALSLGFYGLKGGVFAFLTGGEYRVWGPPGTFFEGNNELGLVLIMTVPVLFFLRSTLQRPILRHAMLALIGACVLAVLSTHSRGALLAIGGMTGVLWLKSNYKVRGALLLLVAAPVFAYFMPEEWWDRMRSIGSYQEDGSAMGRLNAWQFAINLAMDKPLTGGGFRVFSPDLFLQYAPDPLDFHDAHSIYFETLAEQGFVGLGLFIALGVATFATAGRVIRRAKGREDLKWASTLCSMLQASLAGYAVGGAFLGLAYFDLLYHIIVIVVVTDDLVNRQMAGETAGSDAVGGSLRRSDLAARQC